MSKTSRGNDVTLASGCGTHENNELVIGRDYCRKILPIIRNAKVSIDILMFHWAFYDRDLTCEVSQINNAIIQSKKRGVNIRCFVNMPKTLKILRSHCIDAKLYSGSGVMHAKAIICDNNVAVFGSHNLSQRAMCFNKELSIIVRNSENVLKLKLYFDSLWRTNT